MLLRPGPEFFNEIGGNQTAQRYNGPMTYVLIRIADAADWQVYHAIRRSSLWEERGLHGYDDARPQERFAHHHALLLKLDEGGSAQRGWTTCLTARAS